MAADPHHPCLKVLSEQEVDVIFLFEYIDRLAFYYLRSSYWYPSISPPDHDEIWQLDAHNLSAVTFHNCPDIDFRTYIIDTLRIHTEQAVEILKEEEIKLTKYLTDNGFPVE